MTDRYDDEHDGDERLDEYLCEYVDGTMDPSVRLAFEEYLSRNPDLAQHVRRLSMTRSLLCSRQQCAHAPRSLQHRLQIEIARDLMGADPAPVALSGLGRFATVTSFLGFAVLLGALVGTSLVQRSGPTISTLVPSQAGRAAAPSDAHGHTTRARPAQMGLVSFGSMGPSYESSPAANPGWILAADSLASQSLRRTSAVP